MSAHAAEVVTELQGRFRQLADAPVDPDWQVPPMVIRIAQQIDRGARMFAAPESVAMLIASTPEVREALVAAATVEKLKARHVKRTWETRRADDAEVAICSACQTSWPCEDAEILGVA